MTDRSVIAAFDFDGTLTTRDTVVPFLRRVASGRSLSLGVVRCGHRLGAALVRRDRDRLRAVATDVVFSGRPVIDVRDHAEAHGVTIHERWLRADTVARLEWHQRQGHTVVIVSASYESYVRVVAGRLGVDDVLATRLEVGPDGSCTGRLVGPNCRGPEKVRRLTDWLGLAGLTLHDVTLWAYGDSAGDRELLAAADHPHLVDGPIARF